MADWKKTCCAVRTWVFYLMLAALFLRPEVLKVRTDAGSLSVTSAKNLIALFLILSLPMAFRAVREKLRSSPLLTWSLISSCFLIVMSVLLSRHSSPGSSWEPLLVVMVYFLFFFSVQADALCLRNRRAVFLIFAACFLIVSAANFVFHAVKGFSAIIEDYPFWPGKNMFSVFLFTGLFLILGRASEIPGRAAKILLWSAVALGVFDLVLANSRAGVIAFAAGVLIWIFLMRGKKRLAGIACLVLLAALGFLSPTMRTRLLDAARMKDYNTQERAAIWKGTVDMIRHRPVLGVGAGRFSQEFFDRASDFFFKKVERKRENYHSHNLFLQIGAESGLPAAVLLMGAYLAIFINAFSLAVKGGGNLGTTCALGSFFIYSLMDCTYNARFTDASMFHVNIIMLMLLAGVFDADQFKIQNEKCKIDESDQLKMQNAK